MFVKVKVKFYSASPSEKAEVKRVRELFASDQCINQGLFDSFQIQNPEGVLYTLSISHRDITTHFFSELPRPGACWREMQSLLVLQQMHSEVPAV